MFNERTMTNETAVGPASRELCAGIEMASGLWVPEGTAVEMPYVAGPDADTGRGVVVHRFRFHDPRTGRSQICHVPAHPDAAPSEIEDMAAEAFESFLTDARTGATSTAYAGAAQGDRRGHSGVPRVRGQAPPKRDEQDLLLAPERRTEKGLCPCQAHKDGHANSSAGASDET